MPIEALISRGMAEPFEYCPRCGKPFESFLRGQVARFDWFGLRKHIWAVICRACKDIVAHESIGGDVQLTAPPGGTRP